jgi:hypothetical protein
MINFFTVAFLLIQSAYGKPICSEYYENNIGSTGDETSNFENNSYSGSIKLIDSAHGESSSDVSVELSGGLENNDVMILFTGNSGVPAEVPDGWSKIEGESYGGQGHENDLNMFSYYKVYKDGDSLSISLENKGDVLFVSLSAYRGVDISNPIVDSKMGHNSAEGYSGESVIPSVRTKENGVLVAAVIYDDPHEGTIDQMDMIFSVKNGDDGFCSGYKVTDSDESDNLEVYGKREEEGGGDEISMAVALNPSYSN